MISIDLNKNVKKKRPTKITWYNWLINYIPVPVRKTVSGSKDKVVSPFKTNTPKDSDKQSVYGKEKKPSKRKTQKHFEQGNIIKNIRNSFKLKKENEAIKDQIIRNNRSLFQQ